MTKLNAAQVALIDKVKSEILKTKVRIAEVKYNYEVGLWDAEAALRAAVKEAIDAGVPTRQLGLQAFETETYSVVKRYLPGGVSPRREVPVERPVEKKTTYVESLGDELYVVVDSQAREWEFWKVDFDGYPSLERSAVTNRGNETANLLVTDEVMQVLKNKFGDADYSLIEMEGIAD